jgi:hypothetical protein
MIVIIYAMKCVCKGMARYLFFPPLQARSLSNTCLKFGISGGSVTLYVYCLSCILLSIVGRFHGVELSLITLERTTVQALGSLHCETDDRYQLSATSLQFLAT